MPALAAAFFLSRSSTLWYSRRALAVIFKVA